jgi:signal transduction histidine kinase
MTNWLLAERNNELDQFAYVASHDLKAPLRAISNLSEWIEEDLMGEISIENQAQMQLLRRRVHRMDALLDGLLEYSRVGRVPTQVESIDVEELLAEIMETLEPAETFKFDIMSMPTLNGRKLLLKQVFTNLIDNAIKHHPSQSGLVKISAIDLGGDRYEFAVTDDGKGINPQFHKRIFNVFQTLQARDVKESTGIGLAIVKKIVESEGGQIWLKSELGKGASFHFTWLNLPIERLS